MGVLGFAAVSYNGCRSFCTSEGTVCYANFLERSPDHGQFMNERDPLREVAGFRGRVQP
jgi:hypothetical protein